MVPVEVLKIKLDVSWEMGGFLPVPEPLVRESSALWAGSTMCRGEGSAVLPYKYGSL